MFKKKGTTQTTDDKSYSEKLNQIISAFRNQNNTVVTHLNESMLIICDSTRIKKMFVPVKELWKFSSRFYNMTQ